MKPLVSFIITVRPDDVEFTRSQMKSLGYVYTEHPWIPRRDHRGYQRQKGMLKKLQDKLLWGFCLRSSNRAYLRD